MIKTKVPIASTAIATLRNLFFSFFISNIIIIVTIPIVTMAIITNVSWSSYYLKL